MNNLNSNIDNLVKEFFKNKEIYYDEEIIINAISKYEFQLKSHLNPDDLILFEQIKLEQSKLFKQTFERFIKFLKHNKK